MEWGKYTQEQAQRGGRASVEVRTQNHVHMKTEAWAKTAEASGLGALVLVLGVLKATIWATPADRILTPTTTQSNEPPRTRKYTRPRAASKRNAQSRRSSTSTPGAGATQEQRRCVQTAVGQVPSADCLIGNLGGSNLARGTPARGTGGGRPSGTDMDRAFASIIRWLRDLSIDAR